MTFSEATILFSTMAHLRSQSCSATKVGPHRGSTREGLLPSPCLNVVTASGGSAAMSLVVGLGSAISAFGKRSWMQNQGY
jgi:hypothetical protein